MRQRGRGERGRESTLKPEKEQYSASVRVSSELLKDTVMLKTSDSDPQGAKLAPLNVCFSLLDWLLSEDSGGVKAEQQGDKMNSSVVHARDPNGDTVKLTAKEAKHHLIFNKVTMCISFWDGEDAFNKTGVVRLFSTGT